MGRSRQGFLSPWISLKNLGRWMQFSGERVLVGNRFGFLFSFFFSLSCSFLSKPNLRPIFPLFLLHSKSGYAAMANSSKPFHDSSLLSLSLSLSLSLFLFQALSLDDFYWFYSILAYWCQPQGQLDLLQGW
jgi:hypothetical protein